MPRRAAKSAAANEIAAIDNLVSDLEKRLQRLSGTARREASSASDDVGELVNDALSRIVSRVRGGASGVARSATNEATQFGAGAFKKLTNEVEDHPLILLAVATGIGFLAGLANSRR